MNSRERVLTTLDHREPDRVPVDLGGSVVTSIALSTCGELRGHLGLPERRLRVMEMTQQIALVDDDLLDALGADVVPVLAGTTPEEQTIVVQEADGALAFKDDFGATLRKPAGSYYYDWQEFPLKEASIDALMAMAWPDAGSPAHYAGLRERTLRLREHTERALFGMAPGGHDLLNQLFRVRGMEAGMMDLLLNLDFVEAFLDRLTGTIIRTQESFLNEVGDLIDVHFTADDLAGQMNPLISPKLYRKLIKPRWARIIEAIKAKTKAKIFYHSCGAVGPFIPDLIEIGVDILNPVQTSAAGMDLLGLKRQYGDHLTFWGGGCDTQKILPFGTPQEVREDVRRRVQVLAPGGGFVFNPIHNIQPQVPPENIAAMFQAAREATF
jgi:uroporphyrinogen decarboxylase